MYLLLDMGNHPHITGFSNNPLCTLNNQVFFSLGIGMVLVHQDSNQLYDGRQGFNPTGHSSRSGRL